MCDQASFQRRRDQRSGDPLFETVEAVTRSGPSSCCDDWTLDISLIQL